MFPSSWGHFVAHLSDSDGSFVFSHIHRQITHIEGSLIVIIHSESDIYAIDNELDLTVATVCRNSLSLLPRCIRSVQKLKDEDIRYEHLVIDGASTDGTTEFLNRELEQGHISRLISEPDKGLYDAMNKAVCQAKGKVIVFINSDDEICADAVVSCCRPILSGEVEYTIAQALFITGEGEKLLEPNMKRVMWRQPYCHQSMYCSTELLRRMNGFKGAEFPIGADTEIMRRLYLAKIPYRIIPQVSSLFYAGGISNSLASCSEAYELMFHFQSSYRDEIARNSASIYAIFKHLRRYSVKRAVASTKEHLPQLDRERLVEFIRVVIPPSFSIYHRILFKTHLILQSIWYAFRVKQTGIHSKKKIYLLNYHIIRLIIEQV